MSLRGAFSVAEAACASTFSSSTPKRVNHLWAERFDKPLADLFDMQDEIVSRLANSLNAQLLAVEARRAEKAPNPDSMDLYFQGLAWFNKGLTADHVARARAFMIARSPLIPTMSKRLLDRRRPTWPTEEILM